MLFILLGTAAFVLFFLYDLNEITRQYRLLAKSFFAACLLLAAAFAGILHEAAGMFNSGSWRLYVFGSLAVFFLILLLYTLFFALPFAGTYLDGTGRDKPQVCRTGVYGLCRHPGVLWFAGMCLCLWLALPYRLLLAAGLWFTALDTAYVVLQDRIIFPRIFSDYEDYQHKVPFLLPGIRRRRD